LPTWLTSLRAADPCKERELISQYAMGLSNFHDTLLPIILNFGGDIGDGSRLSAELPLICCRSCLLPLLLLLIIAYICIIFKVMPTQIFLTIS
jgi:hypothetical protein